MTEFKKKHCFTGNNSQEELPCGHKATMWHEGSGSFYEVTIHRPVTLEEALFDPSDPPIEDKDPPPWPWPKSRSLFNELLEGVEALAAMRIPNPWKEAVIDACVIDCIGWDEDDPRATIRNLIDYELRMYIDPRIGTVPEGWVLVPTHITDEMLDGVTSKHDLNTRVILRLAYPDMLIHAPHPPKFRLSKIQIAGIIKKLVADKILGGLPITPQDWFDFAAEVSITRPEELVP